jgi:hypothetical protein
MEVQLAQMVALTCYGNAAIRGQRVSDFFPNNSTCKSCESIIFKAGLPTSRGDPLFTTIALTPDQWFESVLRHGRVGLRLRQKALNNPDFFAMVTASAGIGREWSIEVLRKDARSEFWICKREIGNEDAPDGRIWRVTYGLYEVSATTPGGLRSLEQICGDFRLTLTEIRAFAEREHCGFTKRFDDALLALNGPRVDRSSLSDLIPPETMDDKAISLLNASIEAWVFGGMGSWNDLGWDDESVQAEYESLSDRLLAVVQEAIATAASSSLTPPAAGD